MAKKGRGQVQVHPNFIEYAEFIVAHPNYAGLFYDRDKEGNVNWVVTGISEKRMKSRIGIINLIIIC